MQIEPQDLLEDLFLKEDAEKDDENGVEQEAENP